MNQRQIASIFFIIFFILAVILLYINRHFFLEKYYLRAGYKRSVSLFAMNPVTSSDVVFLGDSLTESFPLGQMFPHTTLKNHGISGDTTAGILRRLDQVTDGQPRQIFLMIGTNDLGFGYAKDRVVTNYNDILRQIQQETPRTGVFVQSILPRHPQYAADIRFVNREIAALAEKYGYVYIDLFATFADDEGGIRPEFTDDGLHLRDAGYQQWPQIITPYVYGGGN